MNSEDQPEEKISINYSYFFFFTLSSIDTMCKDTSLKIQNSEKTHLLFIFFLLLYVD